VRGGVCRFLGTHGEGEVGLALRDDEAVARA
jgi:hypothetical protein